MFRILVVDDDKNTRLLFRALLEKEHYTVFAAKNGEAELAKRIAEKKVEKFIEI